MRTKVLVAGTSGVVLAALAIVGLSILGPGEPINLFEPTDPPPGWETKSGKVLGNRKVASLAFVHLNQDVVASELYKPEPPFDVVLKLGEDAVFVATIEKVENIGGNLDEDIRSLSGSVRSDTFGRVNLVLTNATARGLLHVDDRVFELLPASDDVTVIVEIRQEDYPRESEPRGAHEQEEFSSFDHPVPERAEGDGGDPPERVPVGDDMAMNMDTAIIPPEIGVLVVQSASDFDCTVVDLTSYAGLYQTNLNDAFNGTATSEVTFKCTTTVSDWSNLEVARTFIRDDAEVNAWRIQYGADLVVLLVNDGMGSCGWSMYPDYPDYPIDATWADYYAQYGAFSVVDEACALGNYSFAHELGHLFGMKHERFSESGGASDDCAYGYPVMRRGDPVGRTILAYGGYCSYRGVAASNCPRIGRYSYPLEKGSGLFGWIRWVINRCFGRIYGQPCDAPGTHHLKSAAHNGQRLADVAAIVATYSDRVTPIVPP